MSTIDKITKHYSSAISGDLKKMHVAEWDMDVYYRETYPLSVEGKIIELQAQGKTVEALVESLILKAKKENGESIFKEADRVKLMMQADPLVVIKVASAINNAKLSAPQESVAKE